LFVEHITLLPIPGKVLSLSRRRKVNIVMCKHTAYYYCYDVACNVSIPFHNCKIVIKSNQQQKTM